jgi:hypothetical protein
MLLFMKLKDIAIYLNVGTLIIDSINVKIQLSPWLISSF